MKLQAAYKIKPGSITLIAESKEYSFENLIDLSAKDFSDLVGDLKDMAENVYEAAIGSFDRCLESMIERKEEEEAIA